MIVSRDRELYLLSLRHGLVREAGEVSTIKLW